MCLYKIRSILNGNTCADVFSDKINGDLYMKKTIYYFLIINIFLVLPTFNQMAAAGPFISITSIDADTNFPAVSVTATVQNRHGSAIQGLDEENLIVYEDGYRVNYVKVKDLSKSEDYCYLVFSLDSSRSISKPFFASLKNHAQDIISGTGPRDRIALYRFNDTVSLMSNFSLKRTDLIAKINKLNRHGNKTHLFDAIYDSINLLSSTEGKEHRAAIFFTDGKDEGSSITETDILNKANIEKVPLFFICPGKSKHQKRMSRLAKLTGGEVYISSDQKKISAMYRNFLLKLRTRYSILYRTMAPADGKKHQLELRLRNGELTDRDSKSFLIKNRFFSGLELPGSRILLLVLILIMLTILVSLFIIFLKRGGKEISANRSKNDYSHSNKYYRIPENDETLYPLEEEFSCREAEDEQNEGTSYASAWLVEKHGSSTGSRHEIFDNEFTIGSEDDNNVVIDDDSVSDYHTRIKKNKDKFFIFDLVSETGTFLNGKKLLRPRILYDWDEITVGGYSFIFRGAIKTDFT